MCCNVREDGSPKRDFWNLFIRKSKESADILMKMQDIFLVWYRVWCIVVNDCCIRKVNCHGIRSVSQLFFIICGRWCREKKEMRFSSEDRQLLLPIVYSVYLCIFWEPLVLVVSLVDDSIMKPPWWKESRVTRMRGDSLPGACFVIIVGSAVTGNSWFGPPLVFSGRIAGV